MAWSRLITGSLLLTACQAQGDVAMQDSSPPAPAYADDATLGHTARAALDAMVV